MWPEDLLIDVAITFPFAARVAFTAARAGLFSWKPNPSLLHDYLGTRAQTQTCWLLSGSNGVMVMKFYAVLEIPFLLLQGEIKCSARQIPPKDLIRSSKTPWKIQHRSHKNPRYLYYRSLAFRG